MAVVNIRRDVQDKFYRYRMPLLQTKIEGRGNGIKTVIPNMSEIARSLSRPPTYPTKFFGFELGAQTSFDDKTDRYIVNGAHEAPRLRELLDGFIDKFVLCGSCKNPETALKITKTRDVLRDCKACGKRTGVDMKHKLTTFIIKHPPPKKAKGTKGAGKAGGQDAGDGSDDELTKRIQAEAADIPTAEQRAADGDDDWSVDTSEEAVAARVKALEGNMKASLVLGDDDDEEDEESPYGIYGQWLLANRKGGEEGREATPAEVYKKAQELGIEKKHKAVQVLVQGLLTEDAAQEIDKYAAVLVKMVTSEKHQKSLMGGIERLAGVQYPSLVPNDVPKMLMQLYQIDVIEEDFIKSWGTHVSKKYVDKETSKKVRRAAAPFLEWLDQAESDDDDEDDEETEGEAGANGKGKKAEEEDDSDLDDL